MSKQQQHTTPRRRKPIRTEVVIKTITALAALIAAVAELIKALR